MKGTVRTDQPVVDGMQPRVSSANIEFMSDVCGVDAKDEEHENRHGSLLSVMGSRTSQPLVLNIIQCSRHVQRFLRCIREE